MGTEGRQDLIRQLAAIIESSSDAILGGTLDGVITYWNASAERIFGFSAQELIGRRAAMLVPAARAGELAGVLDQLRAGQRIEPFDTQRYHKDGSLIDVSVSVSPVRDANGVVVGAATVARDITDRVRAQEHRSALEAQLRQAERLQTVGQLTSGIAHDFKNLLSVIVGYAELGQDRCEDREPELRGILEQIHDAADRAEHVTGDLLSFSRRVRAEPEALDVGALLAGVSDLLAVSMSGRAEAVIEQPTVALPAVRANRGQLEQVLLNLAVNARDAMPEGGRLTIRTSVAELDGPSARQHPGLQPGRHVQVEVADTGTGMSPQVSARVFDRFFTTKPAGTGTGLGLSTVHGIIADAGGAIEVESTLGRGTTFRIYLPAATSPPRAGHE